MIQGLGLSTPSAGGPGSIPGQGTRSHLHAAVKTQADKKQLFFKGFILGTFQSQLSFTQAVFLEGEEQGRNKNVDI